MSIHPRQRKRDGRTVYVVRLRDPNGRQYKRFFMTRRAAELYEANEKVDRSRGAWIDPRKADTIFGEVAGAWLDSDPGKTESSLSRDSGIICNHLKTLERRPVGSITPSDMQALVTTWSRQLAPRTVRRNYDVLRAICTYAVDSDFLARTPRRNIKLPKVTITRRKALSKGQLFDLADALGPQYGPMVYVGAALGLRWGECAGLRVADLDFLNRTVTVNTQRTRGIGGRMVEGMPKSDAGRRTLTVPSALMELLAAHLQRRRVTAADPEAYVFVGTRGGPLQYTGFRQRVWKPACRKIGLPDLGFHDLRRTNATLWSARVLTSRPPRPASGTRTRG